MPVRHSVIEVKFKGTRKEYYKNPYQHELETGDPVTVESATGGWDVGYVSLTGELVKLQMRKYKVDEKSDMMKKVLRRSSDADMLRYEEGKGLEQETMIKARQCAYGLNLQMKISDVEYQGDRTKATFFYTAEGRVDFRELIKTLAKEFKIKVEMRQIGLRQEAGRLGGIGSCGRELCCSTWLTDFHSVPTTAARYQNLFLNPLKLSGQCGRLKCCLNYELDIYVEALKEFPDENIVIKTEKGIGRVEKMDILKRLVWFRYMDDPGGRFYPLELPKVKKLLEMNAEGILPSDLEEYQSETEIPIKEVEFKDTVGEERLDRFDRNRNNKKKKRPGGNNRGGNERGGNERGANPSPNRPQGQGPQEPRGPRQQGPQQQGPNPEPRGNNPRNPQGGQRQGGPRPDGPRPEGRQGGPRQEGQRQGGPRPDGPQQDGPRQEGQGNPRNQQGGRDNRNRNNNPNRNNNNPNRGGDRNQNRPNNNNRDNSGPQNEGGSPAPNPPEA